jgi:hypothetical protein
VKPCEKGAVETLAGRTERRHQRLFLLELLGELEEFLGQLSPMTSELFIESVCDVPDRVSCDNPRINLL